MSSKSLPPIDELRRWNVRDVSDWLKQIGSVDCITMFKAKKIDGVKLSTLSEKTLLMEMNSIPIKQRTNIIKYLKTLGSTLQRKPGPGIMGRLNPSNNTAPAPPKRDYGHDIHETEHTDDEDAGWDSDEFDAEPEEDYENPTNTNGNYDGSGDEEEQDDYIEPHAEPPPVVRRPVPPPPGSEPEPPPRPHKQVKAHRRSPPQLPPPGRARPPPPLSGANSDSPPPPPPPRPGVAVTKAEDWGDVYEEPDLDESDEDYEQPEVPDREPSPRPGDSSWTASGRGMMPLPTSKGGKVADAAKALKLTPSLILKGKENLQNSKPALPGKPKNLPSSAAKPPPLSPDNKVTSPTVKDRIQALSAVNETWRGSQQNMQPALPSRPDTHRKGSLPLPEIPKAVPRKHSQDLRPPEPEPPALPPARPTRGGDTRDNDRPLPPVPSSSSPKPGHSPRPSRSTNSLEEDMESFPWYFGDLPRAEAESKLLSIRQNGAYLVRRSQQGGSKNPYTLSVYYNNKVWYLHIRLRSDKKYALGNEKEGEPTFSMVSELIQYHQRLILKLAGPTGGETKLMAHPSK